MRKLHTVKFERSKGVTSVWMPLITCQLRCVMCLWTLLLRLGIGSKLSGLQLDFCPLACYHQNTVMVNI